LNTPGVLEMGVFSPIDSIRDPATTGVCQDNGLPETISICNTTTRFGEPDWIVPSLQWLAQETPEFQSYMAAFAKGINDYKAKNPGSLSEASSVYYR
jgi:hypothetical protein